MTTRRHLSSRYLAFLKLIHLIDPECQKFPDYFFPEDEADPEKRRVTVKVARQICKGCEMKNECFTYAIETNQRYGIWGGTLPDER